MGDFWLSPWMWIILTVLFILTVYITYHLFKKEEEELNRLEKEQDTPQNEIQRSLEYETTSITNNVKRLAIIYIVSILGGIVAFFVYSFYFYK